MKLSTRLRIIFTSATTVAVALAKAARRRSPRHRQRLAPGDMAPEFTLEASDGRTYRLSDYRRKQIVVLAWFPKAFTGGCSIQCASIDAHLKTLHARGAAVFGANVDAPETNRQFAAALELDFPILSDRSHVVARAYGVEGGSGLPSRWTFFIGLDGRILSVDTDVHVSTNGVDIEHTLQQLQTPAT